MILNNWEAFQRAIHHFTRVVAHKKFNFAGEKKVPPADDFIKKCHNFLLHQDEMLKAFLRPQQQFVFPPRMNSSTNLKWLFVYYSNHLNKKIQIIKLFEEKLFIISHNFSLKQNLWWKYFAVGRKMKRQELHLKYLWNSP